MKKKLLATALAAAAALNLTACGTTAAPAASAENTTAAAPAQAEGFTPALDTDTAATLEIAGFMGNYEALDQVINAFNEIYPNVVFNYDHNSAHMLNEYLQNNAGVDIFMTSADNVTRADEPENYVAGACLDLSAEDLDLSNLRPDALEACTVEGKLLRLPVAMNPCGIVVNKTLLENEGLTMPTNYQEFLDVLEALKQKGYTPLQGSHLHLYGELMVNMAMDTLQADDTLLPALQAGDDKAVQAMLPVFERLQTIIDNGYTDYELNATFAEDNYNSPIMDFFDNADMPFYVCQSECYSGMKKRESKSEAYSADPFEYEFVYAPLGDDGAYAYTAPWYGFSVNKNADEKELAIEFLRFMAADEQIEKMASIKGMPAVNQNAADERYTAMKNQTPIASENADNGTIPSSVRTAFNDVCTEFGAGTYTTAQEAAEAFVARCKV